MFVLNHCLCQWSYRNSGPLIHTEHVGSAGVKYSGILRLFYECVLCYMQISVSFSQTLRPCVYPVVFPLRQIGISLRNLGKIQNTLIFNENIKYFENLDSRTSPFFLPWLYEKMNFTRRRILGPIKHGK